jgi:hypothetical protein
MQRTRTQLIVATLLLLGCAIAEIDLPQKAWHVSPSSDPRSSTSYPYVAWNLIERIRPGMSEAEVEGLIGQPLQFYHHPINAIVYSRTPRGKNIEVALKRGADGTIEDLSYKLWQ